MDVRGVASNQKEIESLQRILKQRDEEHARQNEKLQKIQSEQIQDLEKNQAEQIDTLQKNYDDNYTKQKQRYDDDIVRTTDSFKRQQEDERRDFYDKYGKLNQDAARDRFLNKQEFSQQIKSLVNSNSNSEDTRKQAYERSIDQLRNNYNNEKQETKHSYDGKLENQKRDHEAVLSETTAKSRNYVDENVRKNNEELAQTKRTATLQQARRDLETDKSFQNVKKSFQLREQQLADEKNLSLQDQNRVGTKALEDYRERLNDSFKKVVNDFNYNNSIKDQENSKRLSDVQHDHRVKENALKSEFRNAESTLKNQNQLNEDRNRLQREVETRRSQQEQGLALSSMAKNNETTRQALSEEYNDRLLKMNEKNRHEVEQTTNKGKGVLAEMETRTNAETSMNVKEQTKSLRDQHRQAANEKNRLIREYETRQKAIEDLKSRQLDGQHQYYSEAMTDLRQKTQKEISQQGRDFQTKNFQLTENFRNTNDQLNEQNKSYSEYLEKNYDTRVKRLNDGYNRSIVKQQASFEDVAEELRYDGQIRMSKSRGDAEHGKKLQLLEMQAKNRMLSANYETKLNQMKDEHTAAMDKTKAEHERELRDLLKRSKENLDKERVSHNYEMEAKSRQMEEKLKLQEQAFNDQLEKIRRTNELALKKS